MSDDWPWTESDADELHHLWDGSDPNWALLKVGPDRYLPFNRQGHIMLIEATGLNDLVCRRMIDAGCDVLKEPTGQEAKDVNE